LNKENRDEKDVFVILLSILLVLCLCIGLMLAGRNQLRAVLARSLWMTAKAAASVRLENPVEQMSQVNPVNRLYLPNRMLPRRKNPLPTMVTRFFSSTKQDFSFLYDEGYTAKWSEQKRRYPSIRSMRILSRIYWFSAIIKGIPTV
jgi:hypothetical protein